MAIIKKPDTNSRDLSIHGNHIFKPLKKLSITHLETLKNPQTLKTLKTLIYSQTLIPKKSLKNTLTSLND